MAQDGALVLAFDCEVDTLAKARAVDYRLAHVVRCEFYRKLVKMVQLDNVQMAMESTIIDQNPRVLVLGVCLGPGSRPWRGDERMSLLSSSSDIYKDISIWLETQLWSFVGVP
jgi:hypothetical protein